MATWSALHDRAYGANAQADAPTVCATGRLSVTHTRTDKPEISTGRPTNPPRAIPSPQPAPAGPPQAGNYTNTPGQVPAGDYKMGEIATLQPQARSVIGSLAEHYGMDKAAFVQTIKATIMGNQNVSNEQIAAFCLVAKEHRLNPFTKEIFAFPSRGGIVPVVSVDGWMKLVNSHPQFDGMEFRDTLNDKAELLAVTCRIFRKDRAHAVEVTEYMSECRRST